MLSQADNERLTRTNSHTPLGKMFRQYWIPALMSSEILEPGSPPVRVQVLGEKLIAFRDAENNVGILEEFCPHRRASLFFGRNEGCGIRCVYHGWMFDLTGDCVDMPSEPPDSTFKEKVKARSYPVFEAGGLIWVYLGPIDQIPPVPDFIWTYVPESQRMVAKVLYECNFLQAFENEIDLVHAAFLHRRLSDDPGRPQRNTGGLSPSHPLVKNAPPRQEIQYTKYGFRNIGSVGLDDGLKAINVHPIVMPFYSFTPRMSGEDMLFHAYVPRDDWTTWNFEVHFSLEKPINPQVPIEWRGLWVDENYRKMRNADNLYLIDHEMMKKENYSGILGVSNQDAAVIESMGFIVDRSQEKLGTSDLPIITYRRLLLNSLEQFEKGNLPFCLDQNFPYEKIFSRGAVCSEDTSWQEACPLPSDLALKEDLAFDKG